MLLENKLIFKKTKHLLDATHIHPLPKEVRGVLRVRRDKNAYEYYYEISKMLGLPSKNIEEGKNSLIALISILKKEMKILNSLKDLDIEFKDPRLSN